MALEETKAPRQELIEFLDLQSMEETARELWNNALPHLDNNGAQALLDVLHEDPTQLVFLTNNLQSKIDALKKDDQARLDEITEEENAYVEGL